MFSDYVCFKNLEWQLRTAWWGRFRMIGVIDLDRGYGSQEVTKKNKFFFTLIAADSGWGLGGEGGRNSFLQLYFFRIKNNIK